MKIDVCRGEDLQTLYSSEADGENVMDDTKLIKTNLTEPDVDKFCSSHEKLDVWCRFKSFIPVLKT